MATIFCNVEADINDDFINRFPKDFDFDGMLRKISEDAGVSIVHDKYIGVDTFVNYRLKGFWLPMEKAYKYLVTTLAQYHPIPSNESYASGMDSQDVVDVDVHGLPDSHVDISVSNDILKSVQPESKRPRRSRKSSRQNKISGGDEYEREDLQTSNAGNSDSLRVSASEKRTNLEVSDENNHQEEVESLSKTHSLLVERNGKNTCDKTSMKINSQSEHDDSFNAESAFEDAFKSPAKRGPARKRKSASPLKRRGIEKKQWSSLPAPENEPPVVKKRGRPKLNDNDNVKEFHCSECSFVATKRSKLQAHRLRVHEASPVKCDLCPKVFPSKRYMLRHRASHTDPQHCCDICGKMYKIRKAMLEHRKTHDGAYKKPKVTCELCSKTFCNRYILECHIKDIHMGQKKSFLCSTCGKSFTTRHSLTEHTNAHIGVKPHVCEICGKSFSYESALRDHRFTHADDKHFWCKHCQKGFSQRSGLKMHMRIHRQHKMFICSECGRGFTQKQALQRHERVHKGEKPFVCKHCGRLFTDASIIRRHLILVHKINKDAKAWREDIVCTVKSHNDYQVQKMTEEEDEQEAERVKNELFVKAVGGAQHRVSSKGPSRAFSRTYPRRVALLDEQGNVIAPPEIPQRPAAVSSKQIKDTNRHEGFQVPISLQNNQIILAHETICTDLDVSAQVLGQRFSEAPQWDNSIANSNNINAAHSGVAATTTTHMEHIILEEPGQPNIEHVQNTFHKLIKYEVQPGVAGASVVSVPEGGVVLGLNDVNVASRKTSEPTRGTIAAANTLIQQQQQQQQHHQQPHVGESSSSICPLSFTISTTQSVNQTSFENSNPQTAHTGNMFNPGQIQYFDGRSTGLTTGSKHVTGVHAWPPMFYYSQLANQFGMNINPEYPYVSGAATSSSPVGGIKTTGQPSPPLHQTSASTTTFILQTQPGHLHSLQDLESTTGMKVDQEPQNQAVLHLDSCVDQPQLEHQASELSLSTQQDSSTSDIQERHLRTVPVEDELVFLQQKFQQHQHQHHHQEDASPILITPTSSQHDQHQHQDVDLVEHLTGSHDMTPEHHTILVHALDAATRHLSPNLQTRPRDDSLSNIKADLT
ncbi:gdnf-inducible Zinc finger protein 1 [Plakobranchus ocellatus]|uniref:Gdnf-inducible Zinc finger protein 1 n=1 Tax=Plakobranchus ocellatus TaxID=259542 RepID=A0AAV3Z241_9GAST|nr:gdnf-inducible Zinc finger protein 1 [Plakobranchus ocellatus]